MWLLFVVGSGCLRLTCSMASTTSPSTTTSRPYAGKAHEYVPEFSNKASEYKEDKKRVLLYEKKMSLAGRAKETAFNIIAGLTGRAWDAREDLQMANLEAETGVATLLKRLDSVFKYDAITELPNDFESFFMHIPEGEETRPSRSTLRKSSTQTGEPQREPPGQGHWMVLS